MIPIFINGNNPKLHYYYNCLMSGYPYTSNSAYGSHYTNRSIITNSPSKRTYKVSPPKYSHYPLGLQNLTNTCYISSILQVLFLVIDEKDFPVKSKSQQQLTSLFLQLKNKRERDLYKKFKQALDERIEIVRGWQQQDAHQFLIQLIQEFRKENPEQRLGTGKVDLSYKQKSTIRQNWISFRKQMEKLQKSKIITIFYGDILKQYKCDNNHIKYSFERFSNLSLAFSRKKQTSSSYFYQSEDPLPIKNMIEDYLDQQIIEGIICQKCKCKKTFLKRSFIYSAPKYLILHLSRFIKGYYDNQKNKREVQFQESLQIKQGSSDKVVQYKIFAIVHHIGSLNRGHYYVDIKVKNEWFEMNDQKVSIAHISRNRNLSKSAYILFYERS